MLALVLASALVDLPEIRVELGTTATREVQTTNGWALLHGGSFYVEDESIAAVRGTIPPRSSSGEVTIEALNVGETRLMVFYISGISLYREPVATLTVECNAPRIAAIETELPALEGEPVTLHAITRGSPPVLVEWREGDVVLGSGETITTTLPPGTHAITAVAETRCGTTTAETEVVIGNLRVEPLPEIHVEAGKTIEVDLDAPGGGSFAAENPRIAFVRGDSPRARIDGVKAGRTRMMLVHSSGLTTYRTGVATIVVGPPCDAPTIAVAESDVRVVLGQPVTLHALATGAPPLRIEWREGETLLGTGETLIAALPHGVHDLTAVVQGACGNASADVRVTVVAPRRRAVRR